MTDKGWYETRKSNNLKKDKHINVLKQIKRKWVGGGGVDWRVNEIE